MPREHHQHARPALLPRARHTHRHGGISLPRVPPRGTGAVNSPAGLGTGQPRFAEPSRVGTQASADRGPRRPAQALTQTKPNPPPLPPPPVCGDTPRKWAPELELFKRNQGWQTLQPRYPLDMPSNTVCPPITHQLVCRFLRPQTTGAPLPFSNGRTSSHRNLEDGLWTLLHYLRTHTPNTPPLHLFL